MTKEAFFSQIKQKINPGLIFSNPKEGTSEIISVSENSVTYKRGNSSISIKITDLYEAYLHFKSSKCSSSDLMAFNSKVFSEEGHGCNCTFFFLVLKELGLCNDIMGSGVKNNPFYVNIT